MRSGLTRRELLGAFAAAPAVGAASGRARARSSAATAAQTGEEWSEFAFDAANTGHNPDGTPAVEDIGGRWRARTGGRLTVQPAVAGGVVYAASQDGRVYAFDAASGAELDGWPVDLGSASGSAPAVVDGVVYVGDDDGRLHAIDATSGETQWRFGTGGRLETPPVVVDGTVYVSSTGGGVYAVEGDPDGVTEQWSFETDDQRTMNTGPAVATVDTGDGPQRIVYVGTDSSSERNGAVLALDEGEQEWAFPALGPVASTPAVADGWVYVCSGVEGDPTQGRLYRLDAGSGEIQGELETGGQVVGSPAVTEETVYVGSRGSELYAFDIETGTERWRFRTNRPIVASPAVVDGTVYVLDRSETAYALDTDGQRRWSYDTGGSQFAAPAVANGTVYVPSVDSTEESTLYALGEGGEIPSGRGGDGGSEDSDVPGSVIESEGPESDFAFLLVPAIAGGFVTLVAGVGYAIIRSGLPEKFAVDEAPIERLYDDDEGEDAEEEEDRHQSPVWDLVVGDVITRADDKEKAATQNVIVSKYVDRDTLDSPVVAYEIESARDEPVRLRLSEPLVDDAADGLADQPLNEGWRIDERSVIFEADVGPGETIRTMIGRQDCPTDRAGELGGKPTVSIGSDGA